MEAPSAEELKEHPVVKAAFASAWADSFPDDPALRHEEGGFIYANPTTGEIIVRRAPPGSLQYHVGSPQLLTRQVMADVRRLLDTRAPIR